MGDYFEPLIFNAVENAANNAAESMWTAAEGITHYILLPYLTYKFGDWVINGRNTKAAGPVQAPQHQPRGFFSRLGSAALSVGKKVSSIITPFISSHTLNKVWMKEHIWDNIKPLTTAFMRPMFERILPRIYDIWDKGDINFTFREWIPGGPGTWTSFFTAPLRGVRGIYQGIVGRTFAEKNSLEAYELGSSIANATEATIVTARDILASTKEIGPCLASGPEATYQCMENAGNYLVDRTATIREALSPVTAAFAKWSTYAANKLFVEYPKQAFNMSNNGLWNVAQGVGNAAQASGYLGPEGAKLLAKIVYGVEVTGVLALSAVLAKVGGQLAYEKFRMHVLGGVAPVVVNNHNGPIIHRGPGQVRANQNGQGMQQQVNVNVNGQAVPVAQNGGQPPVQGGLPPVQGGQVPVQGGQPPVQGGQVPVQGGQPPVQGGQLPVQGGQPPVQGGGLPPVQGGQPVQDGGIVANQNQLGM